MEELLGEALKRAGEAFVDHMIVEGAKEAGRAVEKTVEVVSCVTNDPAIRNAVIRTTAEILKKK